MRKQYFARVFKVGLHLNQMCISKISLPKKKYFIDKLIKSFIWYNGWQFISNKCIYIHVLNICLLRINVPFGPRKSGMPVDVLIPAPVNTTQCLLCFTSSTNLSNFSASSSFVSTYSGCPHFPLCA